MTYRKILCRIFAKSPKISFLAAFCMDYRKCHLPFLQMFIIQNHLFAISTKISNLIISIITYKNNLSKYKQLENEDL